MTYDNFLKLLDEFEKIQSFTKKIEFANQNFQRIGSGSGRIVYDIDGTKVFKLAKNAKGVAQNEAEINIGSYNDTHNIVTKVLESDNNGSWIISEKAKKVNEGRIKQLTGIPSLNELFYFLRNHENNIKGGHNIFSLDADTEKLLNDNEFVTELQDIMSNYSISAGDLGRPSTYGEVLRDGQPTIVLTDYGLTGEVYDTHYSPQRKKNYRMYELYDNNDGNDDILGDMPPQDAIDTRRGMWAQIPYSVGDGSGVINEGFISFILDRDKYPTRVLPSAPYIVDEFHNCVNNIDETLNHVKNKKKFYENLLKLQEYLIEQKFYDREPLGEIVYLKEDGSALYSTDNAMGQDNFPVHNNIDTSPSIENDLNANINIEEDLEYRHVVGDATEDQYMLDEEVESVNKIKLSDVYPEIPDKSEMLWNFITINEYNNTYFEVKKLSVKNIYLSYNNGQIEDSLDNAKEEQLETIKYYENNIEKYLNDYFVVNISDKILIDGYHKIVAFFNKGVATINAVDISSEELNEERKKSYMAGSSTVEVKQKCKLAGNGNTSTACNQGDINNLNIKPLKEEVEIEPDVQKIATSLINDIRPSARENKIIKVDMKLADEAFKRDVGYYISKDDAGIFNRREKIKDLINSGELKYAPMVNLSKDDNNEFKLSFTDGRHRFAQLRDMGATSINLSFNKESLKYVDEFLSQKSLPNINEEISPNETYIDQNSIKTVLNGKGKIGFVHINKPIAQKLEKHKIGVIPIRMTSQNTMTAIIYRDKIKAFLLYEFTKRHGGYLDDKTPEEAYEIGKLLDQKPSDIEEHIRNKYGNKVPLMSDKSPDDFNYLAENESFDFWDLNEENFPEFEKDIEQDVTTHRLNKKFIRNYQDGDHTYSVFVVNGDQVRDSGFIEWVDGGNHWVDADLPKDKQKYASHIGENEYWIDDVFMVKPADFEAILLHERTESFIIRHYGYEYDDAHEIANKIEMMFRKKIPEGANRAVAEKIYDIFVANFKPEKSKQKHKPVNEMLNESSETDILKNKEAKRIYNKIVNNINKIDLKPTDSNDYVKDTKGRDHLLKGVKFNLNVLDKNYNIDIILAQQLGSTLAFFDHKNNKLVFLIIEPSLNNEHDAYYAKLRFKSWIEENTFIHEFTHYLDSLRYSNTYQYNFSTERSNDNKDLNAYYNSPEEFNAFTQEIISKILKNKKSFLNLDFKSFFRKVIKTEFNDYESFIKNLSKDNLEKLQRRVYKIYDDLSNPVNEMLNEAQIMGLNYLPFREDVEEAGGKIYSVGGAVRDEFLGKESKDLDILITGVPFEQLEEILGKYGAVNAVGKSFGVLKFKPKGATEDIDIAIPRTETVKTEEKYNDEIRTLKTDYENYLDSVSANTDKKEYINKSNDFNNKLQQLQKDKRNAHKAFTVKSDHALPIEKDLERRDFTINAIAKDIDGNVIDPFGGQEDLKNKVIKVVNPQAFSDDPLRMLRAVQFASRFGFTIDPDTMKMIQKNAGRVKEIAPERILTEFDKIIHKGDKLTGALLLRDTGLLKEIFGNDAGGLDLGRNIWENVRTMGEFVYLLSKNLVSDPAEFYKNNLKGDENVYREIKALQIAFESGEATNLIEARSIAHNMYVISPTSLQSQILPNVIKTAAQELLDGKYPKTVNELAVNGNDLMKAGLQGKSIGDMQKSLLLKIYANKVMNNKEDLLSLAGQNKTMIKEDVGDRIEYGCLMLFLNVPTWSKITSVVDKNDLYINGGDYGIEKEPHVTILYGFENEVTADEVFKLFKENAPLRPIEVRVKGISVFENPEFDVVKFDVNSDELARLNGIMKQLPNTSTFPDYHAHITIAYVKKGEGKKYIKPFEKEKVLKGDELVYSWKGHTEKEEENVLKLNEKNSLNEFAYPEVNANQNNTWDINGEQVGIPFFVEKYDIWNQGGYTDPSEASVLEFIQNNYEDFTHDEKLKKELLLALTDRNILDESVINEMSIQSINYHDVITPEYIKQIEMSDNFERFIEYYKYEYNLITHDNEEIENTSEFKNWFTYELSARYDEAVERITNKLKPDGTIDIWRRITVDDEENRWISHLADAGKHLGIYWSWDERAAEAHWGNSAHNNDALIKSSIKEEYIDWRNTLYANMDMSLGEEEKEITLFKNTSLKIEELYVDDNDVMTSDFASVIKNKTFYA